jgi:Fe2+ or Zn2+ uptake regulation protein
MTHQNLDYAAQLRDNGYRLTPQREIILNSLCQFGRHVSIAELYETVYEFMPVIDRATVYRTLHLFEELRLVVSAEINGQTVYEVASATPHHHLVCRKCGDVSDLDHTHFDTLALHLRVEHQFEPDFNHMTTYGICGNCQ